jgi:hypothetical protein
VAASLSVLDGRAVGLVLGGRNPDRGLELVLVNLESALHGRIREDVTAGLLAELENRGTEGDKISKLPLRDSNSERAYVSSRSEPPEAALEAKLMRPKSRVIEEEKLLPVSGKSGQVAVATRGQLTGRGGENRSW